MQQSLLQSTPWGRKALDLLLRPGEAGQAAVNRGPGAGLQTLLHSESPQQASSDFETNRAHFLTGLAKLTTGRNVRGEDIYKGIGKAPLGHVGQGVIDAGLGAGLDPTTALGFSKAPAKLAAAWDEHALPAVMRAGAKLDKRLGSSTIPKSIEGAHTLFDVDAKTKRELASLYGSDWYEKYAQLWAGRNAAKAQHSQMLMALQKEYKRITGGLSDKSRVLLLRAINNGTEQNLAKRYPDLARRAEQYKNWTDTVAHLRGSKALQQNLGAKGFNLPSYATPFDAAKPRQIQRTNQYLQRYVPNLHMFSSEDVAADPLLQKYRDAANARRLERVDLTKTASRNLRHRTGPPKITLDTLPEHDEAAQAFMRSAARSVSAKDLQRRLGPVFSPTGNFNRVPGFVKDYLKPPASPPLVDWVEEHMPALNRGRAATKLGAAGLFYQPTPHMRNITFLQMLADPGALPATLKNYAKLRGGFVSPEKRAAILKGPIGAGAVGVENEEATQTARAGAGLRSAVERAVPGEMAAGINLATKPLERLYGASNKMLWSYDDAAKAALAARNKARGMSAERGALEANQSLVNYNEASPFTEAARYGAPFATWRTKMPAAVGRSLVRNPQYATALARLDPRLTGGQSQPEPWQDKKKKSAITTPLGEVLGGLDDPMSYARGSMTTTLRELFNIPANYFENKVGGPQIRPGMPGTKQNYFTYGQPALPYAEQQIPYLGQALDLAGKGTFKKKAGQAALEGLTGIREAFPQRSAENPTVTSLRAKVFDEWQKRHPDASFKKVIYAQGIVNHLPLAKLVETLKAMEAKP